MEALLAISVAVIAVVMVLAVIFLVAVALQARRAAREVERVFETARREIAPLSHDVTIAVGEMNGILKSIREYMEGAEEGISSVRRTALRLRELEDELSKVEEPLLTLATLVRAVSKAVEASMRVLRS